MFYRRKIILALSQVFGGRLKKNDLQKLLFLVCQKQKEPEHVFIPYLYGCYSHSAKSDLFAMVNKDFLTVNLKRFASMFFRCSLFISTATRRLLMANN